MRRPALLAAFAAVLLLAVAARNGARPATAQSPDLLLLTSNITYDVKATDTAVHVLWETTVTNNDPSTQPQAGQTFYYAGVRLPVLIGATNVRASDVAGNTLQVSLDEADPTLVQSANVTFVRGLFYQQKYTFQLAYDLENTRSQAIIVTPYYAYVPLVSLGNPATVTVNAPPGNDPWSTALETVDCPHDGSVFTCAKAGVSLAGIAEVSQPGQTGTTEFTVSLADKDLAVNLTYFRGEEATAQHQQALITAALPVLEETYGFDYAGPPVLKVAQGGQQLVLGYEGLTSCGTDQCNVVISPIADDYTVIHELAHLWTPIYSKRWLQEGFAEFMAETVGPGLPPGTVAGAPPQRPPSTVQLQLDTWGETTSLLTANPDLLATESAGYDYSLRFLQELRDQFGIKTLQAVNRNIATSGHPADSQRFMDLMEAAAGEPMDSLFQIWVFPDSYRQTIADRREARDRLSDLRQRLTDEGLRSDVATAIQSDIDAWKFDEALSSLDAAETGLETYRDLLPQLTSLQADATDAGLAFPAVVADELNRFDFESARGHLTSGRDALTAYTAANARVSDGRSLWTRFGLLGSSPGGSLEDARRSFADANFDLSAEQSRHAQQLIDDASFVAFRRLLIVAGFLGVIALAVGIALVVGRFRDRALTEP